MNRNQISKDYDIISKLHAEYVTQYDFLKKEKNDNVSYEEYAKSDGALHRGCYCPSPIEDIVVGRYKRGKIVKKADDKCTHIYRYNDKNELSVVCTDGFEEFVIKKGNTEIGLIFDIVDKFLSQISYCEFDKDRLKKYILGDMVHKYSIEPSSPYSIYKEEYVYSDNELSVDIYISTAGFDEEIYAQLKDIFAVNEGTCTHLKYYFPLNNGCLTDIYFFEDDNQSNETPERTAFSISKNKRRKIL